MTDDLPFDYPTPDRPALGAKPRCRRHAWRYAEERGFLPDVVRRCARCGRLEVPLVSRTNRNNRLRGNRTSRDLAAFLGGRNVEALKLPWDVETPGCRIQSKRLAARPSLRAIVGLIEAIDYRVTDLRAFYHVEPARRLASGLVYVGLREWVEWHGWDLPADAQVSVTGPLISMPLATFRDLHVAAKEAA